MASLYIKDQETAELAREVAEMLGTTKTAAVRDALLQRRRELRANDIHERLRAWRAAHPLGEPTGLEADKAFYELAERRRRRLKVFLDASAVVALMTDELGSREIAERLDMARPRLSSPVAIWEASRAMARKRNLPIVEALAQVEAFAADFDIDVVPIGAAEGRLAIEAHERFGKGRHPANLNMGDCFAYACARANDARLLYKGDDFAMTDLA